MSEFVMVKREILETYLGNRGGDWVEAGHELGAVLAQEAGHVEELLGMVEPTAWLLDGSVGGSSLDFQITDLLETQNRHGGCLVPLFRVPPAPVSVVLPEREHVPETELYNTNIDEVAYAEGWNNAIDKVKELNQ